MSGSKYYNNQGLTSYNGNLGTIYYNPTGGNGNGSSNFMTTVNFSRTARSKTLYVRNNNEDYGNITDDFIISQNPTPLVILLDDIDGNISHGTKNPLSLSSTQSYYHDYVYNIHQSDFNKSIPVIVLINGNVISLDTNNSVGNDRVITNVSTYSKTLPSDGYILHYPTDGGESYEDYPSGIGGRPITSYKLAGSNFKGDHNFDVINHTNGTTNSIDVTNAGGLLDSNYVDYGKINGLILILFYVTVTDKVPGNDPSTITIGTAVYSERDNNHVDPNCMDYRELRIVFQYNPENPSIQVGEDLTFNADGTEENTTDHEPTINVESNITWEISE